MLTSDIPRTILIDEPNSFLHPGAAKKLIETLKQYPQHQYVLSTHSPEVIRATAPETIIHAKWHGDKSELEEIAGNEVNAFSRLMAELGMTLSDVFGADRILWVEGRTEEYCFPQVIEKLGKQYAMGTKIVGVLSTGDFNRKKDKELVYEIYDRLSTAGILMPPTVAFLFDRELRSDNDIEDMSRRSGEKIKFLPLRSYENYLIFPGALAAVMSSQYSEWTTEPTPEAISDWLTKNGGKKRFFSSEKRKIDFTDETWREKVDGAQLLITLFSDFSDGKFEFRKTRDSLLLTEWLLENQPGAFDSLAQFLSEIITSP